MRVTGPPLFISPSVVSRSGQPAPRNIDSFAPSPGSTSTVSSASTATSAKGLLSVDLLMTIAGTEGGREQRKRLVAEAEQGLQHLENIHTDALKGQSDPLKLERLSAWLANQAPATDPSVASIMKDIDLRARVELAKRSASAV